MIVIILQVNLIYGHLARLCRRSTNHLDRKQVSEAHIGQFPGYPLAVFLGSARMPLPAQEFNLTIGMQVPDRKMTNKIIS